jgi:hypothetical protein
VRKIKPRLVVEDACKTGHKHTPSQPDNSSISAESNTEIYPVEIRFKTVVWDNSLDGRVD